MNAPLDARDASDSPAAGGSVRRYAPADRDWVAELIGGTAAIDAKGNRIEVAEDGADKALAVWHSPEDGDVAILGPVLLVGPERRDLFYAAILAACEAALAEGYARASFYLLDRRMVTLIRRDFNVFPTPVGRNVKTGQPGHWELTVDLADAATKLRRFALPPEGFM